MNQKFKFAYILILAGAFLSTVVLNFLAYEIPNALWGLNFSLVGFSFAYYIISQNMILYVLKRLLEAFVTILVVCTMTFMLLRVLPGGPFDEEKALPPEVKLNIEKKYKLNEPLYMQYYYYMSDLARGDLGESYKFVGRPITEILWETLPVSFQLGFYAILISFIIGIPAGVIAASRHNTLVDNFTMIGAISGVSVPNFLVAAVLITFFAVKWRIFPPGLWDGPEYYILPIFVLGIRPAAVIARLTRSSVLDVISSDYIRTAKAKGLSERAILFKHVLKNSLIPVLTYSGPLVAAILSGSFVIELIFAIPGMAKHLVSSVSNRDYPLILGTTLVFSLLLIILNLIVDLLYSFFDPRIRLS